MGEITHEALQHVAGGVEVSSVQYQPTDRPIEDRFSITLEGGRLVLGLYDGHGGSNTAEHISKILLPTLLRSPPHDHRGVFEAIDNAMLDAFKADHAPFRARSKEWRHHAQVLRSGCTTLILDIDIAGMLVHYANAGDCRALVCDVQDPDSEDVGPLQQTTDLNAKSPSEQERLKVAHPNEDLLVVSGRLFGKLMSTRGFGDGYYKLPRGINNWQHKKYIDVLSSLDQNSGKVPLNAQYDSYFYGYRTPPYLISTPDVGVMSLTGRGFIVCGSDGLFDLVTSEEVARTVRKGIKDGVQNLAAYVLSAVMAVKLPGDDVTILVLKFTN
ncbi:phosphatase 2C-like domain-containing protein [Mycena rosella]|uniref:Phosphatase 2C-like domain-containing protein n=1 Tax=Mycena rosella TaxID=1033263 RepID=A0AAD7DWX2_MYCRO|nr:phosphatase 2C-like domain-containing protein [Mycena rosella]